MARWRMRSIKCPRCKDHKREPVNIDQMPRVDFKSLAGEVNNIYVQTCHPCCTSGASPALQAVYDQSWQRILRVAQQHEEADKR